MIPVLIVGGGPVGLALALDLGWRGVPCLLVEQSDGEIVDAKMFMTGIRTLEFCRRWGIAEQVKNWGFPCDLPTAISSAAAQRGLPLDVVALDQPAVTTLGQRKLVLCALMGHVAWRGDAPPADALALIDRVRGAARVATRHAG